MKFTLRILGFIALASVLWASCDEKSVERDEAIRQMALDSTRTAVLNVSGELFSIPSPIQTAAMLEKTGAAYVDDVLTDADRADTYATNAKRALNLGVYGADMAYASLYKDVAGAAGYYTAIEKLSHALDLSGAIDASMVKRVGQNAGNPDSLMVLSSEFYMAIDAYLKENDRYDMATMVLFGGWLESVFLTGKTAMAGNAQARQHLAEQKQTVSKLNEVMGKRGNTALEQTAALPILDSLNEVYGRVDRTYHFVAPETDTLTRTTHIRSETTYHISDATLMEITRLLTELRKETIR